MIDWSNPTVVAAVISAIVSVITVLVSFLLKSYYERHFQIFKLESEHLYEQRKQIKSILSKNKIQLLNACASLNDRLGNFSVNYDKRWHHVSSQYSNHKLGYYLTSFVYRLIAVYGWIRKIENEMIYLDTTVASREDLEFVKFISLMPDLLCDVKLFEGFSYDDSYAKDHFFKNHLERMADCVLEDVGVCSFSDFQENIDQYFDELIQLIDFLNGISPEEQRLRWDRLQLLHIVLITFLNSYGYDFQYTNMNQLKLLLSQPRKSRIIQNFIQYIEKYNLDKQKEMKKVIKAIKSIDR